MISCIDFAKKPSYLIENGGKKSNSFYKNKNKKTDYKQILIGILGK